MVAGICDSSTILQELYMPHQDFHGARKFQTDFTALVNTQLKTPAQLSGTGNHHVLFRTTHKRIFFSDFIQSFQPYFR